MVKLDRDDIRTKEVLEWTGLHVFHAPVSSCSQKLRIFLNFKGLEWESHPLDLLANENLSEFFLGINPRGLVPVLIDNGDVHIESNDILMHIERTRPEPPLMPPGHHDALEKLLKFEDDLHLDLRALSFRFLFAPPVSPKSSEDLERYATTGSGTVQGEKDSHIAREIGFWETLSADGITDKIACDAAMKFKSAFDDIETRLSSSPYLMGEAFSILDIAWIVYANRLKLAGYPLAELHPRLAAWLEKEAARPEVAPEIATPPAMADVVAERQRDMEKRGQTLNDVCFA